MSAFRFRAVTLAAPLCVLLVGCVTWEPSAVSPRKLIDEQRPVSVRVWQADGASLTVHDPRIEKDSIVVVDGTCRSVGRDLYRRYVCPTSAIIALDDVRVIEMRRPDRKRMTLLSFAILGPLVTLALAASAFSPS